MRHVLLALCMALSLATAGLSAASAAPLGVDVGRGITAIGDGLTKVYAGYCEDLRRRCVYKDERGEWGQGNCHRYRVECGHALYCERLREACRYKYERGEEGQGNCRRYKYECNP
jgi:hypothetical protein